MVFKEFFFVFVNFEDKHVCMLGKFLSYIILLVSAKKISNCLNYVTVKNCKAEIVYSYFLSHRK